MRSQTWLKSAGFLKWKYPSLQTGRKSQLTARAPKEGWRATYHKQFSRPRRSTANANAPEIHTTATLNKRTNSIFVWLRIAPTPPCLKSRGVMSISPKRAPGVPMPKTITAIREPQEGLMTGPWELYHCTTAIPMPAVAREKSDVRPYLITDATFSARPIRGENSSTHSRNRRKRRKAGWGAYEPTVRLLCRLLPPAAVDPLRLVLKREPNRCDGDPFVNRVPSFSYANAAFSGGSSVCVAEPLDRENIEKTREAMLST